MSDFNNPTWIDEQLRNVALPPGLIGRLREVAALGDATLNDAALDSALREVPFPPGLLVRLREIATLGDAELDHSLRDVPVPEGLLEELRLIGSLAEPDLDAALRDVPLPLGLRPRLVRNVRWQTERTQWFGLAIAAGLLAMIGVGWLISLQHGPEKVARQTDPQRVAREHDRQEADPSVAPLPNQTFAKSTNNTPTIVHPNGSSPAVAPQDGNHLAGDPPSPMGPKSLPTPSPPIPAAPNNTVFGVPTEPLPDLIGTVPEFAIRGVTAPRVKQYDLPFELRYGVHPFVYPAANPTLRESRVPTDTGTASYDLAWRMLQAGQSPAAGQIRVEDFLAAQDYQFPPPTRMALGIRAAGGPSPIGGSRLNLLQLGVQAGPPLRNPDSATHLTLLVDGSDDMRAEQRWESAGRALARLSQQLTADDRVSLIVFGQRADVLLRRAGKADLQHVVANWNSLPPGGPANVVAAIQAAAELAPASPLAGASEKAAPQRTSLKHTAAQVVLLAGGPAILDAKSLVQVKSRLQDSAAAGVHWEVVNVRQDELYDTPWAELAAAGGHPVRHAPSPEALYQRLLESLAGRSQIVAGSVSLKVVFNPEAVVRYRLIGHEATGAGGLSGGPLEADLRTGQAATALYELELKPDGPQRVATVEVAWHEPGSEQIHHVKQDIGRLQFAPSWRESALPLQLATLAAATAETLRGSYFAPPPARGLDLVAELAEQANPHLAERPSFVQLKEFIDRARRAAHSGNVTAAREIP